MAIPPILNEAAAIGALVALGVPIDLAHAMVAHWNLEKQAKLVEVFGQRLSHEKAALLREKVAATKEQYVKKLLQDATAKSILKSYGIPEPTINALVALWAAQVFKEALPP